MNPQASTPVTLARHPLPRRIFLASSAAAAAAAALPRARAQTQPAGARKVRIGIVGGNCGLNYQFHLHPDCSVLAVCDIRESAIKRLKETYRCDAGYADYAQMLKHPGLSAVGIFTPPALHVPMAVDAMRRGLDVICACPAGLAVEELELLLECARSTGRKYMMAETSYYRPEIIAARDFAAAGEFGAIFYAESEFHQPGWPALGFDEDGKPNWRNGYPPMLYATHCTGMILPVTGERLVQVSARGWGDDHPILKSNPYKNPFWNTTALFHTSGGNAARVSVCWRVASGEAERVTLFGTKMTYSMGRPEGSGNMIQRLAPPPDARPDAPPPAAVNRERHRTPDFFERLPEPLRVSCPHGNSHTFLTHEFVSAITENRKPAIDVHEAIAYTLPGIVAHQSAMRDGETLKIKDYGR